LDVKPVGRPLAIGGDNLSQAILASLSSRALRKALSQS